MSCEAEKAAQALDADTTDFYKLRREEQFFAGARFILEPSLELQLRAARALVSAFEHSSINGTDFDGRYLKALTQTVQPVAELFVSTDAQVSRPCTEPRYADPAAVLAYLFKPDVLSNEQLCEALGPSKARAVFEACVSDVCPAEALKPPESINDLAGLPHYMCSTAGHAEFRRRKYDDWETAVDRYLGSVVAIMSRLVSVSPAMRSEAIRRGVLEKLVSVVRDGESRWSSGIAVLLQRASVGIRELLAQGGAEVFVRGPSPTDESDTAATSIALRVAPAFVPLIQAGGDATRVANLAEGLRNACGLGAAAREAIAASPETPSVLCRVVSASPDGPAAAPALHVIADLLSSDGNCSASAAAPPLSHSLARAFTKAGVLEAVQEVLCNSGTGLSSHRHGAARALGQMISGAEAPREVVATVLASTPQLLPRVAKLCQTAQNEERSAVVEALSAAVTAADHDLLVELQDKLNPVGLLIDSNVLLLADARARIAGYTAVRHAVEVLKRPDLVDSYAATNVRRSTMTSGSSADDVAARAAALVLLDALHP
eukprot:CAMPEP_0174849006 /NCGR_PEP_ID=MMETSP1114-20130205/13847_1 /TAXON_ID=312471 /ORGANISM="Neobodo designis, Strain CCAP 1951/1" /LENGTH=545 /DNA_ID=CAMNT_0016083313 /DNA_START=93 /DNA_END=1730 /DNA_ORIENTATION=-